MRGKQGASTYDACGIQPSGIDIVRQTVLVPMTWQCGLVRTMAVHGTSMGSSDYGRMEKIGLVVLIATKNL